MELTPRQKAFADEYLKCGNATEAARRAGYKPKSARQIATENLAKPSILAYIAERQKEIEDERIADISEVMQFFTRVMRGEEKDAFGLEISASDRMAAGKEILKRNTDNRKLELELIKLERQLKESAQVDGSDDNFIDALNASARESWEKEDGPTGDN